MMGNNRAGADTQALLRWSGWPASLALAATLATGSAALAQDDDLDFLFAEDPPREQPQASQAEQGDNNAAGDADQNAEATQQQSEPPAQPPVAGDAEVAGQSARADVNTGANTQPARRPSRSRAIEEIIVTATKRKQAIQDVPISMTALSADYLAEQGITDVGEALRLVPNASIDSAGFFVAPTVRGFSFNNNNKSFEPPVGIVLDGVPHTRIPYFNAALFDIERIEVLRGPQGTTFGKNTTAGLFHLISKKPTDEYTGFVTAELGELNRTRLEAAYGGPLTENVNFRVAGLFDQRDGFIRNTTAAIDNDAQDFLKERDRTGLRGTLEIKDLLGARVELAVERVDLFDGGAAFETLVAGPNFQEAVRRFDPNADFIPGNFTASLDLPDFRDLTIESYRAQVDYDIGNWSVVALGAYSELEQTLSLDTDFTPAAAIEGRGGDRSPTIFGELRLVSPDLPGLFGFDNLFGWGVGSSNFLVGITYSEREILDSIFAFAINNGPFFDLVTAAALDDNDADGVAAIGGIVGALPVNPTDTDASFDEYSQVFDQFADAYSVYANFKWQFLPHWALDLGGRFTIENKTGVFDSQFTTPPPNPSLVAIGAEEFQTTRRRREENFQPKISLNYKPVDALSLFAHWEQGFKGGGFNAFAFREGTEGPANMGFEDDDLTFEEESATNWGFDIKSTLFRGAAKLNISFFRQTAEDFQVLIRENPPGTIGLGTSRVVNAEEARAQGVEADLTWLATQWLTVNASSGYLDTEYLEFTNNECPADMPNTDGDDNPRCDASGESFPFAPEYSNALALTARAPAQALPLVNRIASSGLALFAGVTLEHQSSQLLDLDLDERKRQDSFIRLKSSLGFGKPESGWSLRLIGENLTNEVTHIRQGDVFGGVIVGSQNAPRLVYMQFRQDF